MSLELNLLYHKLDIFITKLYKFQLIKGLIISFLFSLILFFVLSFLEYGLHFETWYRKFIFIGFIILNILSASYFILVPLIKLLHLQKGLTYQDASKIISTYFVDIEDKLLNVLELAHLQNNNNFSNSLLLASIDAKALELKPYQFTTAIDKKQIFYFSKLLTGIFLIYLLVYFIHPRFYTNGSRFILNYNSQYIANSPFTFFILNKNLETIKGSDFTIECTTKGSILPDKVYISYGGTLYLMNKDSKNHFTYQFSAIVNSLDFHFVAADFKSTNYQLNVRPQPSLLAYSVTVTAPSYTNIQEQTMKSLSDIVVPVGSILTWNFETLDADSLVLQNNTNKIHSIFNLTNHLISFPILNEEILSINLYNKFSSLRNYLAVYIKCIPDLYPEIQLADLSDSIATSNLNYAINISDDYGFTGLQMQYKVNTDTGSSYKKILIPFNPKINKQKVSFSIDQSVFNLSAGQSIDYYFEVLDNDQIHKPKLTKSSLFSFKVPSLNEKHENEQKQNERINSAMSSSVKSTKSIEEALNKLQQSTIDNSMSDWQKNKLLNELNTKENNIENLLNQAKEELNKRISGEQQKSTNPELLEKQKQLDAILKDLINDDLKKIIDQIEKLKNLTDQKQLIQQTKDLKYALKDFEKQLENNLQLLKRMNLEQKMNNLSESLKDLSIQQQNLADEMQQKNANAKDEIEKINEHKSDLLKSEEQYKDILKENTSLQKPMNLPDLENDLNSIKESFEKQKQESSKNNKKELGKESAKNSKSLKSLADKMDQNSKSGQKKENEENEEDLKRILSNLIKFSFMQEKNMKSFERLQTPTDPNYILNTTIQRNLKEDFIVINDSLNALMKRTPQVSLVIKKDLSASNRNLEFITNDLEARTLNKASIKMQYVMTSINNLALLLSEALNQMQNSAGSGSSSSKPSKSKKSKKDDISDMKGLQDGLKKQLEEMMKQMKDGQGKQGEQLSKQLAEALAKEELFNQLLNELKQKSGSGSQSARILDEISKLVEENKREIINRKINPLTINRQNSIIQKLLQAEKAERERDQDDKRESKFSDIQQSKSDIKPLDSDKLKIKSTVELIRNDIKLNNFFNIKYKSFLGNFKHN